MNQPQRMTQQKICRLCGKKLKAGESIQMGMGSTCYKKYMSMHRNKARLNFMDKLNL